MRGIALAFVMLALSGCGLVAIPPAVTIASYAVDGVSYLVSGKSVTDHAISEVAGADCAMWRMLKMENPCLNEDGSADVLIAHEPGVYEPSNGTLGEPSRLWQPEEDISPDGLDPIVPADGSPVVEAEAERWGSTVRAAGDGEALEPVSGQPNPVPAGDPSPSLAPSAPTPVVTVESLPVPTKAPVRQTAEAEGAEDLFAVSGGTTDADGAVQVAALSPAAPERPAAPGERRFVVIGSFTDRANAEGLARAHPKLAPVVVQAQVDGRRYYRVVTETAAAGDAALMQRWLRHNGFADAWAIAACEPSGGAQGCLQLAAGAHSESAARH